MSRHFAFIPALKIRRPRRAAASKQLVTVDDTGISVYEVCASMGFSCVTSGNFSIDVSTRGKPSDLQRKMQRVEAITKLRNT